MISGIVRGLEAHVKLRLRGPTGQTLVVEAIVDSGFTGCLTLPREWIEALELPYQGFFPGVLADGSERLLDIFRGTILWDRRRRQVDVVATDGSPLIGIALLNGHRLMMDVRPGGKVTIKRLGLGRR